MNEFSDQSDDNKLYEFMFLSAKFDVLCGLLQSGQLRDEKIPECISGISDAAQEIKHILSEDREEFSVVSCDLDGIWQAFQEMIIPPSEESIQMVRADMVCIRDTMFFSDDGGIISLGFKFELGRLHFMKEYLNILSRELQVV